MPFGLTTVMKSNTLAWCCFAVTILCLSTVLEASTHGTQQTELVDDAPSAYRLPVTVEPVSCELRMMPVVDCVNENYTFSGQVDVVIKARLYTSEVILNAKDLRISSVSGFQDMKYINDSWYMLPIDEFIYNDRYEQLVIRLKRTMLPRRQYRFTVWFESVLGNDFKGFHTYFYDSTDNSRYLKRINQEILHFHLHDLFSFCRENRKRSFIRTDGPGIVV